jgi:hypothetical protein
MRTAGSECENNAVDAEALLRFLLSVLARITAIDGGREKLRQLLEQRATNGNDFESAINQNQERDFLIQRRDQLSKEMATAGRNYATEEDSARKLVIGQALDQIQSEILTVDNALLEKGQRTKARVSAAEEVDAAMALFDDIRRATVGESTREELRELIERLGIRIGLNFTGWRKGPKRVVRRLAGGVVVFGDRELPVPLHGSDRVEKLPCAADNAVNILVDQRGQEMAEIGATAPRQPPHDVQIGDQEDISFTKDNRGERI